MSIAQDMQETQQSAESAVNSFVNALHGIIPTLDRIRTFIQDSSGKIPQASKQLSSVASATESATVEILDVLDRSTQTLNDAEVCVRQLKTIMERQQQAAAELRKMAVHVPASNGTASFEENLALIENGCTDANVIFQKLSTQASSAKEDFMVIGIALQVQDITSQQIAGISQLIESVRLQLTKALNNFEHPIDAQSADLLNGPENSSVPRVFDHGASYTKSADRQESADEIIKRWQEEGH